MSPKNLIPSKAQLKDATVLAAGYILCDFGAGLINKYVAGKIPYAEIASRFIAACIIGILPVPMRAQLGAGALANPMVGIINMLLVRVK